MQFQKVFFKNLKGEKLAARLEFPLDETPVAYALFAHCFACSKNLNAVVNISRALTDQGIAVLRFDFTGLGESEGDFGETNFSSNVKDLIAAARFLEENFAAPKLLIGHSMGGAAVIQAAASIQSSTAVAVIAAPFNPVHVNPLLVTAQDTIDKKGEAEIELAGRRFRIKKQFLDDLRDAPMNDAIKNLNKALIIFHSPEDEVVSFENGLKVFAAANQPKSFISLDGADHLLSRREDSRYVGAVMAAWSRKYIGPSEKAVAEMPAESGIMARTGKFGYRTEIIANEHRLLADEPIASGGSNTGPTPYDYLVAALGACTSMTIRMYADRKKLPVDSIVVRLKHQKIHSDDCRDCDTKDKKIDLIEREIEVVGPLQKEQRERLLEIANRCPVHRSLNSQIIIKSSLKGDLPSSE